MAESLTLSVAEAAALLGVSPNHLWARINAGDVPALRLGRRVLVPRRALDDLVERALASRRVPPVAG